MFRPDTRVSLGLFSEAGLDDEVVLQEAEEWTRTHPLSAGFANQGFEVSAHCFYERTIHAHVSRLLLLYCDQNEILWKRDVLSKVTVSS